MPTPTRPATVPFVRSVVHATDFSGADEPAFAHALGLALLAEAQFTILHVGAAETDWRRFPAVRKTLERWQLLDAGSAQADVFAKLGVEVRKLGIESRFPALALARHLDAEPADLLVVATEGREGVARWLRGSVAEAMARWSRTMTLFVPAHAKRNIVALTDGNLTLANVLVPVDRTPDPTAAIEFARRAARYLGESKVTITLLHLGSEDGMPSLPLEDGPEWSFVRLCREGQPVEEIERTAESVRADLIVMPTHGRNGVLDALRGSTTEQVVRRASCPVLAVPAPRA